MTAQLQSVAIYLSQNYPTSALPVLLDKLEPQHPKLAKRLAEEYAQLLLVDLSDPSDQELRNALPTSLGLSSESISLRDCYTNASMSPAVLGALERTLFQMEY